MFKTVLGSIGLIVSSSLLVAAEVKPLKVQAVTGPYAATEVDYTEKRAESTTIVVFINAEQWSRPVARYLKTLDTELETGVKGAETARIVAVWLTENANQSKEYLPKAQMSLNLTKTDLTVFDGPKSGPEGWNVDIAAQLTTVLIRDGKEKARFDYRSTNEQDVPALIKKLRSDD